MEMFRVGEKVISMEKIEHTVRRILRLRAAGSTQSEVARKLGLDRSFISHLEGIAEVRKGLRTALVAFPVANAEELRVAAQHLGIDIVLVLSQEERETFVNVKSGAGLFNEVIDILAELTDCDVVLMFASDLRIEQAQRILGSDKVIGFPVATTPVTNDVVLDESELQRALEFVSERGGRVYEARHQRKSRILASRPRRRRRIAR